MYPCLSLVINEILVLVDINYPKKIYNKHPRQWTRVRLVDCDMVRGIWTTVPKRLQGYGNLNSSTFHTNNPGHGDYVNTILPGQLTSKELSNLMTKVMY